MAGHVVVGVVVMRAVMSPPVHARVGEEEEEEGDEAQHFPFLLYRSAPCSMQLRRISLRAAMEKEEAAATSIVSALMLVLIAGAGVGPSEAAAVHKVGGSVGWTIMGNPNYTAWAMSKNFQVGDRIVFEYNKNFHNVLAVSKEDYKACNAASPMAAYTSGNDSITLRRRGHYFFICGVPGHCAIGQKVDIRIAKLTSESPAASLLPPALGGGGSTAVSNPAAAPRPSGAAAAAPPTVRELVPAALLYLVAYSGGLVI